MDSPGEAAFDRLTRLASTILRAPIALVSLVDADRQFFKSCVGLPEPWASQRGTPLSHSFCQHVVRTGDPLIVADARAHPLVRDNLAIADLNVIAYLGMPLVTSDGFVLGSFCVIDTKPRAWRDDEIAILRELAASVITEIEYRGEMAERQQTVAALRVSEERYRALVQATTQVVWTADARGRGQDMLVWWEETTGQPPAESWDWGWLDVVHPEDRERVRQDWERALATLTVISTVYRLRARDGEYRYFAMRAVPVLNEDGSFREWVGTLNDISERKQAEQERGELLIREQAARAQAERNAERLARLQRVTAALSATLTPEQVADTVLNQGLPALGASAGTIVLLAEDGERLEVLHAVGYPAETVGAWRRFPLAAAMPLSEAVRTGQTIVLRERGAATERYPQLVAMERVFGDGAVVAVPLLAHGRALGGFGISFQNERTILAEDAGFIENLAQLCAQALDRSRLFVMEQQARAEAQEAVRLRDGFFSIAAHELKNPLAALMGHVQLMQRRMARDGLLGERDRRTFEIIVGQTSRLNQMIGTLLDVSRIESGQLNIERARVDLRELARSIADEIRPGLDRHTLAIHAPDQPLHVEGDALRLTQVLHNLIGNAVKYSPSGGAVTVTVEPRERFACVRVADRGVGIPQEALPNLFRRFYRVNTDATQGIGGIGVGLYVVKEIVGLHGGTIEVDSAEGIGSTFTVCLPLATPIPAPQAASL